MTDLKQKTEHFLALADAAGADRWVMVPKEPTEKMIEAFHDGFGYSPSAFSRKGYADMLAAAPQPPAVDVEAVREVIADLNAVDRALWSDEVHLFADQLARAIGDEPCA